MSLLSRARALTLGSLLGLTLTAGSLAGCGEAEPPPIVEPGIAPYYTVDHFKVPCVGLGPQLCLRVRPQGASEWEYHYGGIDGFDFEWGTRSELNVRTEEVPDPPADGSSKRDILESVVRQIPFAGQRFQIKLFTPELISGSAASGFSLGGERDISCASAEVCSAFQTALPALDDGGEGVELDLAHPAEAGGPLVLHAISATSR